MQIRTYMHVYVHKHVSNQNQLSKNDKTNELIAIWLYTKFSCYNSVNAANAKTKDKS